MDLCFMCCRELTDRYIDPMTGEVHDLCPGRCAISVGLVPPEYREQLDTLQALMDATVDLSESYLTALEAFETFLDRIPV